MEHRDLNGEEKLDQKQVAVALEDYNNISADPMTKNRRVVEITVKAPDFTTTNITNDIKADLGSIVGYADQPLLPLYKACAPLTDIIHNISFYVQIALDGTSEQPPDGLTIDESAAIRLYTMEWETPHKSLYVMLNHTLKTADRKDLRPYFKYLKLFLTALVKLPSVPQLTVWRGVTKDLSAEFPPGTSVTWWAFSSCTTALSVLENNMYLGSTGNRTLFSVEAINGRIIRGHSYFDTEEEILLLPGTLMVVQSQLSPASDLHIIHLKQIRPEEVLLELPFEGALLYPKIKRQWYRKKRFAIPICLFSVLLIAGVITGAILGTKSNKNPADPVVNWHGNDWAYACDFYGNDLINVPVLATLCGPKCSETERCTHYAWHDWGGGDCFLKFGNVSKSDAVVTNETTMICGIVTNHQQASSNTTVVWNGNNWAMSCSFRENELSNTLVSADLCGPKCAQTPKCTHFTWTRANNGTCWMKKGTVSKNDAFSTYDASMVCGILSDSEQAVTNLMVPWNGNNWAMSCDFRFPGNELLNVQVSANLCGPKCAQTPKCTHFTWTRANNGTCWMKKGIVSKTDAFSTNDTTMVCGILSSK
ncbi:unnamed protein product [Adineta steineri]|uniref:NAD(P)(+)--arginine ADP-ribosyltransferase n=1 Tax=Adineta steineri TaxID=433720 RepID=A0A818GAD7_9BILA|nr:unnamed protein product [Adineta steineri]CAF3486450.1 unnamed protein product [Adineta steineri]